MQPDQLELNKAMVITTSNGLRVKECALGLERKEALPTTSYGAQCGCVYTLLLAMGLSLQDYSIVCFALEQNVQQWDHDPSLELLDGS
jgi:hypothetical protein